MSIEGKCPKCLGTGKVPPRGRVKITVNPPMLHYKKGTKCPNCQGTGKISLPTK